MAYELKPDYEVTEKRFEAFWHGEIIDRAPVNITLPKEKQEPVPDRVYPDHESRWLDVDFRAEQQSRELANFEYLGDALPIAFPNLGPEIFSAWCGCPYGFGETTTWSEPCIIDWEKDSSKAVLDMDHPLFKKTVKFTRNLLKLGKDRFIVGYTDFHPGGDHLAALRDPEVLAMDLIDHPEEVKTKLAESYRDFFRVFSFFYEILASAGMPSTTWLPLIHSGKAYVPSNDFSCMVSTDMFREFFLEGIREECRFYDRSIYHLDGPGALRHLDDLLAIPELDAIQWVPGAGNEGFTKWIPIYKKIREAGKSVQVVHIEIDELPVLFENFRPQGIWLSSISGIDSRETAEAVLKRVAAWK
ncbi:MAG: hypothetical protein ACLFSE_06310 [Spirochaetia bacterium]